MRDVESKMTHKVEITVSAKDVLDILKSIPVSESIDIITAYLGDDEAWESFKKETSDWE